MLNVLRCSRSQSGATLIEVLITMLLLSFAMLAMANMHAMSLKYVKMAEFRGIATGLALDLADRMRANSGGAGGYVFNSAYDSNAGAVAVPTCANPAICTPSEIAGIDLAEVRNTARLVLPGGGVRIAQDAANPGVLNLWIIWLDPDGNDASTLLPCPFAATPQPQCLAMRVAL